MNSETSMLSDAELDQVSGGQASTPVFRTVLDMSAASFGAGIYGSDVKSLSGTDLGSTR